MPAEPVSNPRANGLTVAVVASVAIDLFAGPVPTTGIPVWLDPLYQGFDELFLVWLQGFVFVDTTPRGGNRSAFLSSWIDPTTATWR